MNTNRNENTDFKSNLMYVKFMSHSNFSTKFSFKFLYKLCNFGFLYGVAIFDISTCDNAFQNVVPNHLFKIHENLSILISIYVLRATNIPFHKIDV